MKLEDPPSAVKPDLLENDAASSLEVDGKAPFSLDELILPSMIEMYESLPAPNPYYQRRLVAICGASLREVIALQQLVERWYRNSPEGGRSIDDTRLEALNRMRDKLTECYAAVTLVMAQEFKYGMKD